jgi:peptidoglycan/xylan/chitin deacetylase (PgdA/CDA1 family)
VFRSIFSKIIQKGVEFSNVNYIENRNIVLMFHQIEDNHIDQSYRDYTTLKIDFINGIKQLSKNFHFVSIDDFLNHYHYKDNMILITFDDGFRNIFELAYPLLKSKQIPFTVFITTDYLNKPGYLTTEQLMVLNDEQLCTIGSHTVSHRLMSTLSKKESIYEVSESKICLEKLLKKEINYFAFPYGSYYACTKLNIRHVQNAGYKAAFSTVKSRYFGYFCKNNFFIPRINCGYKFLETCDHFNKKGFAENDKNKL